MTTSSNPVPAEPTVDPAVYLTMDEIKKRFDRQWVLLNKPRTDRDGVQVFGGYVVCHSPDHAVVQAAALALPRPVDIAMQYVGRLPDWDDEDVL